MIDAMLCYAIKSKMYSESSLLIIYVPSYDSVSLFVNLRIRLKTLTESAFIFCILTLFTLQVKNVTKPVQNVEICLNYITICKYIF